MDYRLVRDDSPRKRKGSEVTNRDLAYLKDKLLNPMKVAIILFDLFFNLNILIIIDFSISLNIESFLFVFRYIYAFMFS